MRRHGVIAAINQSCGLAAGLQHAWVPIPQNSGGRLVPDLITNRHGAASNVLAWAGSPWGLAPQFDGSGVHLSCGSIPEIDGTAQWTIAARVYRATSSDNIAVSRGDANGFRRMGFVWIAGTLYVTNESSAITSFPNVAATQTGYADIVVTFDGARTGIDRLRLWINRTLQTLVAGGSTPDATAATTTDPFWIGRMNTGGYTYSTGLHLATLLWPRRCLSNDEAYYLSHQMAVDLPDLRAYKIRRSVRRGGAGGHTETPDPIVCVCTVVAPSAAMSAATSPTVCVTVHETPDLLCEAAVSPTVVVCAVVSAASTITTLPEATVCVTSVVQPEQALEAATSPTVAVTSVVDPTATATQVVSPTVCVTSAAEVSLLLTAAASPIVAVCEITTAGSDILISPIVAVTTVVQPGQSLSSVESPIVAACVTVAPQIVLTAPTSPTVSVTSINQLTLELATQPQPIAAVCGIVEPLILLVDPTTPTVAVCEAPAPTNVGNLVFGPYCFTTVAYLAGPDVTSILLSGSAAETARRAGSDAVIVATAGSEKTVGYTAGPQVTLADCVCCE